MPMRSIPTTFHLPSQSIPTNNQQKRKPIFYHRAILFVAIVLALKAPSIADAGITRIEITWIESPTFGGMSFGEVGQYEKLVGRAFGEVDPNDPHNQVIVDIALAPRNGKGMVEYSTDIYILKPINRSSSIHRIFFEMNNRGSIISFN